MSIYLQVVYKYNWYKITEAEVLCILEGPKRYLGPNRRSSSIITFRELRLIILITKEIKGIFPPITLLTPQRTTIFRMIGLIPIDTENQLTEDQIMGIVPWSTGTILTTLKWWTRRWFPTSEGSVDSKRLIMTPTIKEYPEEKTWADMKNCTEEIDLVNCFISIWVRTV